MPPKLRDYQKKSKELARAEFRKGNDRLMFWLPTGSGKGLIMADIVNSAPGRVLTVIRRQVIVWQTKENYKRYFDIDSEVIMSSLALDRGKKSTICSIDTIANRLANRPESTDWIRSHDLVLIDECHDVTSESYKRFFWWMEGFKNHELLRRLLKLSLIHI